MKRVLITGVNSYIGNSVETWLNNEKDKYYIDKLDLKNPIWRKFDFSNFDVIFHVAGIAHIKETKKNRELYFNINRDLAFEVAKKVKKEGVSQFIFMSSMSVYGLKDGIINKETLPKPTSSYGKSKLEAETLINTLKDKTFKIVILRPPIIYGKDSIGNYSKLSNIVKKIIVFPDIDNKRSMLHIDNLCAFVKLLIDHEEEGLYFPQNKEYIKTSEMVRMIREVNGKKTIMIRFLNRFNKIFFFVPIIHRVFSTLIYHKSISNYDKGDYQIRNFKESIERSEL